MVSVIILSYNTCDITLKCLAHVTASHGVPLEIIVIDNASSDESADKIKKQYPKVKLIKNKENVGFAKGNNQGMELAVGERILLLNSDCFVNPDTIAALPDLDVVGCKLLNSNGSVQPSWGYFPTLRRVFSQMTFLDNFPVIRGLIDAIHVRDISRYEKEQEVDWVTGAFVYLKREIFEKIGGIDEKYFMYGEEMEWMYRIKKSGFKVWYSPKSLAIHLQGVSTKSKARMFLSEMKGFMYWYKKHNPVWQQILLKWVLVFGCAIRIPAWAVWGKWDLVKAYREVLPELFKA